MAKVIIKVDLSSLSEEELRAYFNERYARKVENMSNVELLSQYEIKLFAYDLDHCKIVAREILKRMK